MSNKAIQHLQLIKERMIAAGIEKMEVDKLVGPLTEELQRRVCGLVWEHKDTSIPSMEGKIPTLTPVTEKNIVNDISGNNHVLIEGENLLALMAMQYTHIDENGKGMIDVIYIDPPYNTGSVSFAYNDKFEKSEWLSMMDIRLKLARNLLKDDGVIFMSIDDNYMAESKLLLDDIYGERNYIATITVETAHTVYGPKAANADKTFVKMKDYLLVYSKTNEERRYAKLYMPRNDLFDTHYNTYIDEELNTMPLMNYLSQIEWVVDAFKRTGLKLSINNLSALMAVNQKVKNYIYFEIAGNIFRDVALTKQVDGINEINKIQVINGLKVFKTSHGNVRWYRSLRDAIHETDDYGKPTCLAGVIGDLWFGFDKDMKNVAKEGSIDFKNAKKPIRLIQRILKWINRPNATVLDFFAGSGTTGHAVLDLNKEDGGHRRFILCTNNELGKEAKKKAKKNDYEEGSEEYEALGVCRSVTYPRMQNIFPDYPGNNLYYYRIEDDGYLQRKEMEEK